MSRNPVFHNRTKYIDTKQHFIRELVVQKEIELEYVHTNEQVADFMTKALAKEKFVWCRRTIDVDDFRLRGVLNVIQVSGQVSKVHKSYSFLEATVLVICLFLLRTECQL
jgi:hypothetical protein